MHEVSDFGLITLVVAATFVAALALTRLTRRFPVPAPALFLLVAAAASDVFPGLRDHISTKQVERIGVVCLIVILFDGGMHIGRRRLLAAAVPIGVIGVVGTFGTAGAIAVFAHYALDFEWTIAGVLGAALAPTDPAVMFSVLGNKEVGGRSGTILEGESGANDPVGIALMIGMLELATHVDASFWVVVREFAVEMAVGAAIGVLGGYLLRPLMRRVSLPNESLYPIRTLAAAGVIYGASAVAHGSGFLAVFIAGLLIGDENAPHKAQIERFHSALASLAEIAVFAALGLTVTLGALDERQVWRDGLVLFAVLALVARPLVVGALLLPVRLRRAEKLFVMWGGLKGAVPILLATFVLLAGVEEGERIYHIVFLVVALSVLVQGTSIPWVARRLGIPMRELEHDPWEIAIGLRNEPASMLRFHVAEGARAVGEPIRDLPLGERAWIALIERDGSLARPGGSSVLSAGDEIYVLADAEAEEPLRRLFGGHS